MAASMNPALTLTGVLTRIADIMGVPLTYKGGDISGGRWLQFNPFSGLSIPLQLQAVKCFHHEASSGIIFSLTSGLYILVGYRPQTGVVSLFMLDPSKLESPPEKVVGKTYDLSLAVSSLRPGIVASYVWREHEWKPFNLPE